ncbi:MAG: hypothetical protein QOF43_526, partial [Gaiellaceae bacterium]|nr:hypothetical protein [Gaiellaceae bacterium]
LDLSLFVLPFAALIVLAANARHLDRPLRVFTAAAVALVTWLTLEVGVFASTWSQRIEERNLFYLAPLFLIALFAWLERGQPRPPRAAVAAAGIAAALPGVIPFLGLLNINAESDTPFLQPWWYVGDRLAGTQNVALVAVAVSVVLAAAFLWLPRRHAPVLPLLVALGFLCTWLPLQLWTHSFPRLSAYAYTTGIGQPRGWIDTAVGRTADVTIVWSGDNPYRGWENEFWNRSVRRAYDLGPTSLIAGPAEPRLSANDPNGILRDAQGRSVRVGYVLADPATQVIGKQVAADSARHLALYRVDGVLRTATAISGWYPDTWTGPRAAWTRQRCRPGRLTLALATDPSLFAGTTERIAITGTTPPRVVTLQPSEEKTIVLKLAPSAGVCRVRLAVSPARRPSDFPALHNSDSRLLGVRVSDFAYATSPGA